MRRDRRNLTPDQLALVMGRHYNRKKAPQHTGRKSCEHPGEMTCEVLARDYGVNHRTVWANGKFAAAVEGRQDPEGRNAGGLGGLGGLSADARRGTPLREGGSLSALSSSKSCA